jgi:Glycosyl transferases group 1
MLELKSLVRRAMGIPDPWKKFREYERRIRRETWAVQPAVLEWLWEVAGEDSVALDRPRLAPDSADLAVRRFAEQWPTLEQTFARKFAARAAEFRVLIHLPPFKIANAAFSLFQNLGMGLSFLGIPVAYWEHWGSGTPLETALEDFRPSLLLSVDHRWYGRNPPVGQASVQAVHDYRRGQRLVLGLSCNDFPTEPGTCRQNTADARSVGADFFYSYQAEGFVRDRYRTFADRGFPVLSLEFGANPLLFHPLPGITRDLDYVYLASVNAEKWEREFAYFSRVFHNHSGFILGPGWPRTNAQILPPHHLRFLYARAKVGVNLHVPFQVADPTELNERAYNLAASGTPQLMDNPALLPERFGPNCVYSAADPEEYYRQFRRILERPDEAAERAINALECVLRRDTVFHRANRLVEFVDDLNRGAARQHV